MAPDGALTFTFGAMQNTQRYNFDFQVTPWFEATFRYGHLSGANSFTDYHRNLGFKIRLFQETDVTPEISLGARDIVGTGRQGAEYLVASKALGDFDLTAGIGWGRLSDNEVFPNPIALIFPSFKTRQPSPTTGGTPAFGQLFHGPDMGVFAGFDWSSPIKGLDFVAEYSSDEYRTEAQNGVLKVRSPANVGISYAPLEQLRIMAGWFYGTTYGAGLIITRDPTRSQVVDRIGPAKPIAQIRTDQAQIAALSTLLAKDNAPSPSTTVRREQALTEALMSESRGVQDAQLDGQTLLIDASYYENATTQCADYARIAVTADPDIDSVAVTAPNDPSGSVAVCDTDRAHGLRIVDATGSGTETEGLDAKIRSDVAGQQLELDALTHDQSEIWLYYRNKRYLSQVEAAGRLVRVLMKDAPPGIEVFHLVLVERGLAIREFKISRSAMERAATTSGNSREQDDAIELVLPALHQPVLAESVAASEPRFTWALGPGLRQSFFDPHAPVQVEIMATSDVDLELAPGLDVMAEGDANIYNNFDLNVLSNSQLPHVRSDIAQYLKHGINGIGQLEADYRFRLAPDVYSVVRVGYLEDMYGGVGGQILWRPDGERISFGVDLYQVWKRDFNRMFGFQNYNILTGHFSVYYNTPWYGLNVNLHVGRYLAGDYGGTIELTRKFETGVEIGAFATFTNVPFNKFGEGSFDKGFLIRVPFEWALPVYTTSEKTTVLHSLTRDGGQRLANDDPLYEETRDASYGELLGHIDELTNP